MVKKVILFPVVSKIFQENLLETPLGGHIRKWQLSHYSNSKATSTELTFSLCNVCIFTQHYHSDPWTLYCLLVDYSPCGRWKFEFPTLSVGNLFLLSRLPWDYLCAPTRKHDSVMERVEKVCRMNWKPSGAYLYRKPVQSSDITLLFKVSKFSSLIGRSINKIVPSVFDFNYACAFTDFSPKRIIRSLPLQHIIFPSYVALPLSIFPSLNWVYLRETWAFLQVPQ